MLKLKRSHFFLIGFIAPIIAYVITVLIWAKGGYDGKHCAGLLDAVWECTRTEYYLDWLLNPFALTGLVSYFGIFGVATTVAWHFYSKCNKGL